MEPIHIKLGKNLKAIRNSRGLSLDKVAELTGVSKAMLAQVERGESSPSISIIWKIANGLHLSFTTLIEEQSPSISIVNSADIEPLLEEEGAFRSYPLFPFSPHKQFEIYLVEMDPNCYFESEAHSAGVEEYIMLLQGGLEIAFSGSSHSIKPNESLRFIADQPHSYLNNTDSMVQFHVLIYYP
ncbi:XRE family transcriptional regulator [Paenibacillus psychroresistens]|uniref:XRE family transcriptional regulator n=1 Tax=Paenibacillus psychroresistens TaxID=1778678 RepID=A0A6B8RP95_9BACL|nr:XRE family transcriptional regulator [Paenibacillus psychroresistens]QGQ97512.1 XRE family transcriptional regulator [Paenibacillus psychroresistens]